MTDADAFKDALGGDVVITSLAPGGALGITEIMATREWFDARRRELSSSHAGGRPTNPRWTMRRQVPLDPATWALLKQISESLSEPRIGPGQVAAIILEEATVAWAYKIVGRRTAERADAEATPGDCDVEPRFRDWEMPEPFSARAA